MKRGTRPGQATLEFAIVFAVFVFVVFGAIEVSRAVYERHALARAAEVIAQELTSLRDKKQNYAIGSAIAGQALQDAARQAGLNFDTGNPGYKIPTSDGTIPHGTYEAGNHTCQPVVPGPSDTSCDLLVNPTEDVSIIAIPNANAPQTVVVTVTQHYHSFLEYPLQFLGGQASETVSATTLGGQNPQTGP